MRFRSLPPVLLLALLASPLAAALCAAGTWACAVEPAAESHCAMTRESPGTAVEAASVDCCADVGSFAPATVAQGPQVVVVATFADVLTAPERPVAPRPSSLEAAVARGGPDALHRLGALLL